MRSYKLVEACCTLHSGRSFRICKDRAIGARDCGGRIGCCTLRLCQKHRRPQSGLCSQNSSVNRLLETMLWKRLCKAGMKFVTAAAFPSGFTECRMDFLAGGAAKAPEKRSFLKSFCRLFKLCRRVSYAPAYKFCQALRRLNISSVQAPAYSDLPGPGVQRTCSRRCCMSAYSHIFGKYKSRLSGGFFNTLHIIALSSGVGQRYSHV